MVKQALEDLPIKVFTGSEALCQVVQSDEVDLVLTAMVGFAGLRPTVAAIKAHKALALANKETLVVAGSIIGQLCIENRVPISLSTVSIRLFSNVSTARRTMT